MFARFVTLLLSILFATSASSDPVEGGSAGEGNIKGALCLIRADWQLVLIEEVLTGKLSLPGGTIRQGEEPKLAAQRETWEETGLLVRANKLLVSTESAYIYDCVSDSEIVAFEHQDKKRRRMLPAWFAPDYAIESKYVYLAYPWTINSKDYRYPSQWTTIQRIFHLSSEQPVNYVSDLLENLSHLHRVEIMFSLWLQDGVNSVFFAAQAKVISAAQLITGPVSQYLLIISLIWLYLRLGKRFAVKATAMVSLTAIFVFISQVFFSQPKPYNYLPILKIGDGFGFATPDVTSAVILALGLLLADQIKKVGQSNTFCVSLFSLFFVLHAGCEIYLGHHYLSDMVFGAGIGWLFAWNFIRIDRSVPHKLAAVLAMPVTTISVTLAVAFVTYLYPYPFLITWLAILTMICVLLHWFPDAKRNLANIQSYSVVFVSLLVVDVLFWTIQPLALGVEYGELIMGIAHIPVMLIILLILVVAEKRRIFKKMRLNNG